MLKGIANQDARRRAAQWLAFLHPLMECLRMPGAGNRLPRSILHISAPTPPAAPATLA